MGRRVACVDSLVEIPHRAHAPGGEAAAVRRCARSWLLVIGAILVDFAA